MTEGTPRFSLLSAARLLDGTQRAPLEDAALLLDGERIARLGRRDDVHAPDGTAVQRVDYGDATLLPGLVEAHTHLVAPGDGTLGDDIAKEDDDILLLQAARNARSTS
jgi:imidazolonepropionase-like amidohydrolase